MSAPCSVQHATRGLWVCPRAHSVVCAPQEAWARTIRPSGLADESEVPPCPAPLDSLAFPFPIAVIHAIARHARRRHALPLIHTCTCTRADLPDFTRTHAHTNVRSRTLSDTCRQFSRRAALETSAVPPLPLPHLVRVQRRGLFVVPRTHTHVSPPPHLAAQQRAALSCVRCP